jgi:hypothetical protein
LPPTKPYAGEARFLCQSSSSTILRCGISVERHFF